MKRWSLRDKELATERGQKPQRNWKWGTQENGDVNSNDADAGDEGKID